MKKLVILSVIASFALSQTAVTDLTIHQENEVKNGSQLSNSATVSQGQTDIKNNSNIENVTITQDSLIDNTQVTGEESEIHQGLTSVDSSRLENADLSSTNTIKDVTVSNGKSIITQGNLIIGGESNVTGTADSSGGSGGMGMGGSSGENLDINQTNLLEDTDIQSSTIHQGKITINNQADVSISFKLNQNNIINRATANGTNTLNGSQLLQGVTNISGGDTSDIEQKIKNVMEDISVDGSIINQSSMTLTNSTVSNINNDTTSDIDDKNRISYLTATNNSNILQSSIDINSSTVDRLYKSDRGSADENRENNWIHTVDIDNSTIKQSNFNAKNGSDISNITYLTHSSAVNANNLIYNSTMRNASEANQDTTTINNSHLENDTFTRANTLNTITSNNSSIKQFNIEVSNSTLDNSNLSDQNLLYSIDNLENSHITQGNVIISSD